MCADIPGGLCSGHRCFGFSYSSTRSCAALAITPRACSAEEGVLHRLRVRLAEVVAVEGRRNVQDGAGRGGMKRAGVCGDTLSIGHCGIFVVVGNGTIR